MLMSEKYITAAAAAAAAAVFYFSWKSTQVLSPSADDNKQKSTHSDFRPLPPKFAPNDWRNNKNSSELERDETSLTSLHSQKIWNNIRQRRSIFPKDFTGEPVPVHIIEEALSSANWAPTHGKTQPWRFVVCGQTSLQQIITIRDKYSEAMLAGEKLDAYRKKMVRKRAALKKVTYTIFIIVKRDVTTTSGRNMPEWEEIAATSCAVQNFHLQLCSRWDEGVGGYWSSGGTDSYLKSKEARELLGAEDGEGDVPNDLILGAFYIGSCPPFKMEKYRAVRGDISKKVTWIK